MEEKIRQILDKCLGLDSGQAVMSRLSGGITNHNYKVTLGDRSLVVRLGGTGTEHLGINRHYEGQTAKIAAKAGISAAVLYSDPHHGILVSEFLEGQTLSPEMARTPEIFSNLVAVIKTIHRAPSFPGSFCPFATVRRYYQDSLERKVIFPESAEEALVVMGTIEKALGGHRPQVSCHNDLLSGNFIKDKTKIWVVDWEYAGMGDLFFDLGNFSINLELSIEDCTKVIQAYFGELNASDLARLHLMRLSSDLREAFWGYLQSAVSLLDFDFRGYGEKHLTRFFQNRSSGDFVTWIKAVK